MSLSTVLEKAELFNICLKTVADSSNYCLQNIPDAIIAETLETFATELPEFNRFLNGGKISTEIDIEEARREPSIDAGRDEFGSRITGEI